MCQQLKSRKLWWGLENSADFCATALLETSEPLHKRWNRLNWFNILLTESSEKATVGVGRGGSAANWQQLAINLGNYGAVCIFHHLLHQNTAWLKQRTSACSKSCSMVLSCQIYQVPDIHSINHSNSFYLESTKSPPEASGSPLCNQRENQLIPMVARIVFLPGTGLRISRAHRASKVDNNISDWLAVL